MTGPANITPVQDKERYGLEKARMHLDAGLLGRLFGSAANAPSNIAGVVALVLAFPVAVLAFVSGTAPFADYVQKAGPFITLALGYLFGRRSANGGA